MQECLLPGDVVWRLWPVQRPGRVFRQSPHEAALPTSLFETESLPCVAADKDGPDQTRPGLRAAQRASPSLESVCLEQPVILLLLCMKQARGQNPCRIFCLE